MAVSVYFIKLEVMFLHEHVPHADCTAGQVRSCAVWPAAQTAREDVYVSKIMCGLHRGTNRT
jgi:hypothetical protein